MAIYQCKCGFDTTDMQEMKRHLRKTGHSWSTGYTAAYQTCLVHLMTKIEKRVETEKGKALKKILNNAIKKGKSKK
jgi:hypothetical protein